MEKILYLVHRIPYPPNKGDKIRSFNILRALSEKYEVYLASFIDDPDDQQYISTVSKFCKQYYLESLNPFKAKIQSLKGMLTFNPLTLEYYSSKKIQQWVDEIINKYNIDRLLVFSSSMAQYVDNSKYSNIHRVIDFVDIDSDKWRQYADSKSFPLNWVYRREAKYLQNYEREIAIKFNYSMFVSNAEQQHFIRQHAFADEKVGYFDNGVDTDFFNPDIDVASPYQPDDQVLVFTGAMDYWANVDAVVWFTENVYLKVRESHPDIKFYIVGTNPTDAVKSLESHAGITVTGRVHDIRAYTQYAVCAVAPLRIARGVQNKVLEAMSMAKVVIASPEAMEGIRLCEDSEVTIAKNAGDYIKAISSQLRSDSTAEAHVSRQCMLERYSWDAALNKLMNVLESD